MEGQGYERSVIYKYKATGINEQRMGKNGEGGGVLRESTHFVHNDSGAKNSKCGDGGGWVVKLHETWNDKTQE